MIEDNYPKAYREVHEILKYIPEEEKIKIPQDIINTIESNMDPNYNFNIDDNVPFEDIILLRETKSILAVIYRDYWADEIQKARIIQKQEYDIRNSEEEKQRKYNVDDILKNKEKSAKALIEYNEPRWYMKVIKFIKKFFVKNKS